MTESRKSRNCVSIQGDLFLKIITQHQLASEALPDIHGDIHREIVQELRDCMHSETGTTKETSMDQQKVVNERAQLAEALRGISLRSFGQRCFDACEKHGLQEHSPFCTRYRAMLAGMGELGE